MKTGRAVASGTVVALLLVAFFAVPLPISRVRQTGLVQLQDGAETTVLLRQDGRLDKLMVHDGQYVHKGDLLARFKNRDLERQWDEAQTQADIYRAQRDYVLGKLATPASEAQVRQRLETKMADAGKELIRWEKTLEVLKPQLDALTVAAPCDGWVINPPRPEEEGKSFDHNQPVPFCTIGDPKKLRVLVPVKPADYRLLKQDRKALEDRNEDVPVIIRVQGRDSQTWQGEWLETSMPPQDADRIPPQLSNKGGGPIAVKPPSSADPNKLVPVDQQYLISVAIKDPDGAIVPGSMAKVKMECRWRSAAWWVWRTLNDTFDLGLM